MTPPQQMLPVREAVGGGGRRRMTKGTDRTTASGAALVLTAAALWATFGLFAKQLYTFDYSAIEVASVRTWLGWGLVSIVLLVRRRSIRIPARELGFFLLYGVGAFASFGFLYFATLERTSVAVAAALLYTSPAFVLLIGAVTGREVLSAGRIAILLMVLAGTVLVTGAAHSIITGAAALSLEAVGIGVGAGFMYAVYTILSKRATERHDALVTLFYMFGFAALAYALFAPPWSSVHQLNESWLYVAGIALVPTLLAYGCFMVGLKRMNAGTAAMLASAEPAIAGLLAFLLLGETLSVDRIIGMVLIVAAAMMLARAERVEPLPG